MFVEYRVITSWTQLETEIMGLERRGLSKLKPIKYIGNGDEII